MAKEENTPTRIETIINNLKNDKWISYIILAGLIIISLGKVTESAETILRSAGIIKSYDVNQATNRGKFSSAFLENGFNRIFWMESYVGRIKRNAPAIDQEQAWQKYFESNEKWNSNLMNYYLGLQEYYPKSGKMEKVQQRIQPKFIRAHNIMLVLRYGRDTVSANKLTLYEDSILNITKDVRPDFYFIMDTGIKDPRMNR